MWNVTEQNEFDRHSLISSSSRFPIWIKPSHKCYCLASAGQISHWSISSTYCDERYSRWISHYLQFIMSSSSTLLKLQWPPPLEALTPPRPCLLLLLPPPMMWLTTPPSTWRSTHTCRCHPCCPRTPWSSSLVSTLFTTPMSLFTLIRPTTSLSSPCPALTWPKQERKLTQKWRNHIYK